MNDFDVHDSPDIFLDDRNPQERGLENNNECFSILQTLATCRGALNGLMSEVVEGHVVHHILKNPNNPKSPQDKAAVGLVELLKTYWK